MHQGSQIARLAVPRHHVDGVPAVDPTLHQGHDKGVAQRGHLHAQTGRGHVLMCLVAMMQCQTQPQTCSCKQVRERRSEMHGGM